MLHINPFPIQKHIVRSKAVDLLFIVVTIVCGCFVFYTCFVIQYLMVLFSFTIILVRKREAGCFAFTVFLMSYGF